MSKSNELISEIMDGKLCIKTDCKTVKKINVRDIVFIVSEKMVKKIYIQKNPFSPERIESTKCSFRELKFLEKGLFYKCHKKYMVNLLKVHELEDYTVKFLNAPQIEVAKKHWEILKEKVENAKKINTAIAKDKENATLNEPERHSIVLNGKKIEEKDINYVESVMNKNYFYLAGEPIDKYLVEYLSMKERKEKMSDNFYNFYYSYLVNMQNVVEINGEKIVFADGNTIELGRRKLKQYQKVFEKL
ncbi:MAG: LytTR family transcriptional regulator DNA-binding domain-containing protein [Clostridiales Family XIII bacterium]|jgi:DNA-binding LytR/AlgR family response regulator|nr:LytTR family transcriptional regulator DNA-binding domain-containing protein [Clostridiales Family XIII bacterium]